MSPIILQSASPDVATINSLKRAARALYVSAQKAEVEPFLMSQIMMIHTVVEKGASPFGVRVISQKREG
ncbi:MAG: hypothetical protein WCJ64_04770 [Rhodospirillaceae bacterium]